jgi:hypothetical protein
MNVRVFGIFGAICSALYGQTGSITGPSSGYVFDPSAKVVRQIRGIPGAAMMGDSLDLGLSAASVEVSPRGDSAVAIGADGSTHFFRLKDGKATERPLSLAMQAPAGIVFSPSGTAVALYRSGNVQVLTGLPDAVQVGHTHPVAEAGSSMAAAAPKRPTGTAFAVSDDATCVLVARDQSVSLSMFPGGVRVLTNAQANALVAFAPGGHDAAVLSGGTLSLFQDVAGASTRQDISNVTGSAGLAFSADGKKVLAAGPRGVTVLDRATGDRKSVECDCRISGLSPMGSTLRLNQAGNGPLWLLDPAGEPKIFFVPARQSE